jgi:tetratricopeptide (TPR) repeat protein
MTFGQTTIDEKVNNAGLAQKEGRFQEAVELYQEVVTSKEFSEISSYDQKLYILKELGRIWNDKLNQPGRAIEAWNQALALARARGNKRHEMTFLYNIGVSYASTARTREAEEAFSQSAELTLAIHDSTILTKIYEALVMLYQQQGNTPKASAYQERLDAMSMVSPGGKLTRLLQGAMSAAREQRVDEALNLYNEAVRLLRDDSKQLGDVLLQIARLHQSANHFREALENYTKGLECFRREWHRPGIASCAFGIGSLMYEMGDLDSAEYFLNVAVSHHDTIGNTEALGTDYFNLGLILQARGKHNEALDAFARAVVAYEQTRSHVDTQPGEDRRAYLADRLDAYEQLINDFLQTQQNELAFMIMELAQARTLSESLHEASDALGKDNSVISISSIRHASIETLISGTYRQAHGVSLDDLRAGLLNDDAALLEFFVGRSHSFLCVVTTSTVLMSALPRPDELSKSITGLRRLLIGRDDATNIVPYCKNLAARLFGSSWKLIEQKHLLYVVPSRDLWLLPFEVLVSPVERVDPNAFDKTMSSIPTSFQDADFLVRRAAFTYGPSSSVLFNAALRPRSAARSLIAFADPSRTYTNLPSTGDVMRDSAMAALPFSRTEVNSIASLFPVESTSVFTGDDVSEDKVKQILEGSHAQVIHFATHGYLSSDASRRVGIVVNPSATEDGILESNEITRMHFQSDLVVLSACESGLGQLLPGEGTMGLVRAFALGGAASVMVSLWQVADQSTAILMRSFYEEYCVKNAKLPQALRSAKIRMIENKEYAAPYYWAPFVSFGL